MGAEFVALSLPPMVIGTLAAIACALPGNFLLLRRQALIGDAISHVVLPGIVLAFLLTGAVTTWPMMIGSAGAALVAVGLIEAVRRLGRVDSGAAMGVIFTAMFAAGVLLLERSDTSSVHLDVEHALMGNLESLIWLDATGWTSLVDPVALAGLPPELLRLAIVTLLIAAFVAIFWRPLKISTFDEGFAQGVGGSGHGTFLARRGRRGSRSPLFVRIRVCLPARPQSMRISRRSAEERRTASSTFWICRPSWKVARAGSGATFSPRIRAAMPRKSLVKGSRSIPIECSMS